MIKNGKLLGRINVFDFAVIILLIVFVLGICAKFILSFEDAGQKVKVTYDIKVKAVRHETVDAFEIGQEVFDEDKMYNIGKISSIKIEDAADLMETIDGHIINAPIENRYNIIISVEAEGFKNENGSVVVNKFKILEGKDITFNTIKNHCDGIFKNLKSTNVSD